MKKFQFIGGLTPPCPLLPFKLLSGSLRSISKKKIPETDIIFQNTWRPLEMPNQEMETETIIYIADILEANLQTKRNNTIN